ncbi:hypothetical protein F5Y19DRAFT_45964 [Xylariaceae sp. FL1651]|nr:hypothetical protein F5Y19DRAFT_45964 [Xylariaceae sp. FL1651]
MQVPSIMDMPSDILLNIVEHMDTATCARFMATNKGLASFIKSYEHSIAQTQVAKFALPPPGNILSSSLDERVVCIKNTFSIVGELELRHHRIEYLLNKCPNIIALSSPPWLPPLTENQQVRLVCILRRALHQCDAVADIAANEPCTPMPLKSYDLIQFGVWALSPHNEELRELDPFTNVNARPAQIEYIRSLPLEDIAGIFLLISILGYSLTQNRGNMESDPEIYERRTLFEECVLRHGTWFIWARAIDRSEMREMAGHMISAGMVELVEWEAGNQNILPGLKMTLMDRFRGLVHGDAKLPEKITEAVQKLVLRDDEEHTGSEPDVDDEQ